MCTFSRELEQEVNTFFIGDGAFGETAFDALPRSYGNAWRLFGGVSLVIGAGLRGS